MQHLLPLTLASLVLASSCAASKNDTQKHDPTTDNAATCAGDGPCGACVSDFRTWLEVLHAEGTSVLQSQRGLSLPVVSPSQATRPLALEPVIIATLDAVSFEGVQVADPRTRDTLPAGVRIIPDLQRPLRRELAEQCSDGESPHELGLTIQMDRRVSWRILRDLVATAESAGFDRVNLAVDKRSALSPPGPSPAATQIAETAKDLEKNASTYAANLDSLNREPGYREALVGSCKELATVFFPPANLEGDARKRFAVDNWPRAVESCGCKTDIEGLKALQWWWAGRNFRGGLFTTSLSLRLASGERPVRIEHPPEATWESVSRNLQVSEDKAYDFALTGSERPPSQARRQGEACKAQMGSPTKPPVVP